MQHLEEIIANATTAIDTADSLVALDEVRVQYLGKKGELTLQLQSPSKLPPEERVLLVKRSTKRKVLFNKRSQLRQNALQRAELEAKLAEETIDVSLPGRRVGNGERSYSHR